MVYVILVKPNVMRKLYGINTIIQRKVQNHQNTFEAFQMLQKILRPEIT